jgi:hypothetical protein
MSEEKPGYGIFMNEILQPEALKEELAHIATLDPVDITLMPTSVMQMIGYLQLGLKSPDLVKSDNQKIVSKHIFQLIISLQEMFVEYPAIQEIFRQGWQDIDVSQFLSKCRVCGCDDLHACPGGCHWVEPDLCSNCQIVIVKPGGFNA